MKSQVPEYRAPLYCIQSEKLPCSLLKRGALWYLESLFATELAYCLWFFPHVWIEFLVVYPAWDWCWESESCKTAYTREPCSAGWVKENQLDWQNFTVSNVLLTAVWSNCSLYQVFQSWVVELHPTWCNQPNGTLTWDGCCVWMLLS